jgi:hypothetical protein
MPNSDERLLGDLQRDAKKRTVWILAIVGIVVVAVGGALLALGVTYEEPHERLATRSVPQGAPIALVVAGVLAALVGLWMLVKSLRAARG